MNFSLFNTAKIINAIAFVVILILGLYFLIRALQTITGNGAIAPNTGSLFFSGINLLALVVLPFFCFIFLKKKHSIYNILILTFINFVITLAVLYSFFY